MKRHRFDPSVLSDFEDAVSGLARYSHVPTVEIVDLLVVLDQLNDDFSHGRAIDAGLRVRFRSAVQRLEETFYPLRPRD